MYIILLLYTAYYSNARFLSLAFIKLLDAINDAGLAMPSVTFACGETLTLQQSKKAI